MNLKNIILKGFLLGVIFICIFFLMYYFKFSKNYFKYNLIVVCFLLPILNVIFLVYHLIKIKCISVKLFFFDYIKFTYLVQLFSLIISIGFIYIFMNFFDIKTKNIFNYQRADLNYQNAKIEFSKDDETSIYDIRGKKLILNNLKLIRDKNLVNFFSFNEKFFILFIIGLNIYCLFLSLCLSLFFNK